MRIKYLSLLLMFFSTQLLFGQVKSPSAFLRHNLGEQFTPHHMLASYFDHLVEESDRIVKRNYGYTNQDRPLNVFFISSPENLDRLETIRQQHLAKIGMGDFSAPEEDIAIVWLSYSVHGNEAGGSESSMNVAYQLVAGSDTEKSKWLENTIVIIDPSLNPDGYSRYSHWYRNIGNENPDPNLESREHFEPWPSGRLNHYYFDLNRDWAWITQVESQTRLKVYKDWMPHVHADVHEQFKDSPYYFAPGAAPFHMHISDWQKEFQTRIGKNSAAEFNEQEWLYITKEVFDLFYPSYGDTYPTFNGCIGMTYEQAGHGMSGRAIKMANGDTLTLQDRIDHHSATSFSAIQVSSRDAAELNSNFKKYFEVSSSNPPGEYKSYIISADNERKDMEALLSFFDQHKIKYSAVAKDKKIEAYDYTTDQKGEYMAKQGDLLVSAYQPLGILTQVLFEPDPVLEDSLTYDITAWSIPHARGLKAYATSEKINSDKAFALKENSLSLPSERPYSLAIKWKSLNDAKVVGKLLKEGLVLRFTETKVRFDNRDYAPGTVFLMAADNRKKENWYARASKIINELDGMAWALESGWAQSGSDMGSSNFVLMQEPKILLLASDELDANSFGYAWYYFEQVLDYPVTIVRKENLSRALKGDYNTLIVQDGAINIDQDLEFDLTNWLRDGGKLISSANSIRSFAKISGMKLGDMKIPESMSAQGEMRYEDRTRAYIPYFSPGAIYQTELDSSHPLSFGLGETYHSLKTNTLQYGLMKNGWNVASIKDDVIRMGFTGYRIDANQPNSMVAGEHSFGRGSVVFFVDDVLFRGFWNTGQQLFSNALFLTGN